MALKVWIDGKLVDKADAKISVYDHGLLYGDGVFEGIRVYSGKIFECEAHLDRLYDSAKAIRLTIPILAEQLQAAMERDRQGEQLHRLLHPPGRHPRRRLPRASTRNKCPQPSVIIIADTIELYPKEMYEKGMAVITASVIRNHPNALSPADQEPELPEQHPGQDRGDRRRRARGDHAQPRGQRRRVHRRQHLHRPRRPALHADHLRRHPRRHHPRRRSSSCAASLGIPCVEKTLQRHDLYIADECFLTGTRAPRSSR